MKPLKNTKKSTNEELVKAAPFAVSGALGAEFWADVEARDAARGDKKNLVEPRKTRNL